jgi:hypothetical protein
MKEEKLSLLGIPKLLGNLVALRSGRRVSEYEGFESSGKTRASRFGRPFPAE